MMQTFNFKNDMNQTFHFANHKQELMRKVLQDRQKKVSVPNAKFNNDLLPMVSSKGLKESKQQILRSLHKFTAKQQMDEID